LKSIKTPSLESNVKGIPNANLVQDFLHRSVPLTKKLLSQGFIETRRTSTLKKCFGRYHNLTLPYRVSVTTMANDICRPWYCCHE